MFARETDQSLEKEIQWVALACALGPRSKRFLPLLRRFGTPAAIFAAGESALLDAVPDMGRGALSLLMRGGDRREAERIVRYCHRAGVRILTYGSPDYPAGLLSISEPPVLLYCKGRLPLPSGVPFVGVVGSRKIDAYGADVTYKLSFELAAAGAVIVSGMAEGADGIAAAAALDAGAGTVAVLGSGIDIVYPKHHGRLFGEIVEFGTVLTEYAPGTPPDKKNFPMRNRIISALSEAVVVTEGDARSGSLITARYALLQGKPLFALPGDINRELSFAPNMLLRAGALLALGAEDILSHFRFLYRDSIELHVPNEAMQFSGCTPEKLRAHGVLPPGEGKKKQARAESQVKSKEELPVEAQMSAAAVAEVMARLTPAQQQIYSSLPSEPFSLDLVVERGIPASEAVAAMTLFEIYGILSSMPGGLYQKK